MLHLMSAAYCTNAYSAPKNRTLPKTTAIPNARANLRTGQFRPAVQVQTTFRIASERGTSQAGVHASLGIGRGACSWQLDVFPEVPSVFFQMGPMPRFSLVAQPTLSH